VPDPVKVDFVAGERDRRRDALERCYEQVAKRTSARVDSREIAYKAPFGVDRVTGVKYLLRPTWLAAKVKARRRKGSVVHLRDQKLGILLHAADLSPCVVVCHDVIEYQLPEYRYPVVFRSYIKPYHTGAAKADVIVAPSRFTADQLKAELGVKESALRVIPNGVDHSRFRPGDGRAFLRKHGLPEDRKYVLYVGSEQPRKDVPTAVRAFVEAWRTDRSLFFLKLGRADELPGRPVRDEVMRILEAAGATGSSRFIEWVDDGDLQLAYSAAHVLVFPTRYEGFGLPVLEAMACGTPVITTNASSIPEVAGDAAITAEPGDHETIASSIARLSTEPGLRDRLVEGGLRRAARFDWDRAAAAYLEVWRGLAGK
jgi:glycosyltransferase involved in cell wall biosynthesis